MSGINFTLFANPDSYDRSNVMTLDRLNQFTRSIPTNLAGLASGSMSPVLFLDTVFSAPTLVDPSASSSSASPDPNQIADADLVVQAPTGFQIVTKTSKNGNAMSNLAAIGSPSAPVIVTSTSGWDWTKPARPRSKRRRGRRG